MKADLKVFGVREAAIAGAQVAAEWLKEAMQQLVGIQCPVAGPEKDQSPIKEHRHSHEGEPPFKESGVGQASIDMEPTPTGAKVGPRDSAFTKDGYNYMAHWDMEDGIRGFHHPWLSLWRRYQPQIDALILREIKMKTGAR